MKEKILIEIANALRDARRFGAATDEPEGARWINLTHTAATIIEARLRDLALEASE